MSFETKRQERIDRIRKEAESDLLKFIRLIAPHRVLGQVHEDLIRWWYREDKKDNQLALLPRDHQKSALVAYRVAFELTKNPDLTILYISATSTLAEKQLRFIKAIFESDIYRRYWPEMINAEEGKREKWTTTEICLDHPKRKEEGVRDSSVFCAGLTTNITGLHCKVAVLDDIVVKENAYTREGRQKVREQYSLLASIETTGSEEWVVGTRYNAEDLYGEMAGMMEQEYDDEGELVGETQVYEVFERVMEDSPNRDGTGNYLWPKSQRHDGKFFGFDIAERARKYAKYLDKTQFYAQYYNDPSDPENARLDRTKFQYYKKDFLSQNVGYWYLRDKRLNIFAAMDLAFSEKIRADFTVIVVVGVDSLNNVYILDIDRFKTKKISEMFEHCLHMQGRWNFRRLRAEVSSGQDTIINEFKTYMQEYGIFFTIDEYRPSRHEGSKQERINATLIPRYDNGMVWHYRGGNCQLLEDELVANRPTHDDISDALAACIAIAKPPARGRDRGRKSNVTYHPRFGGVSFNG